jgi:hypothetical protein
MSKGGITLEQAEHVVDKHKRNKPDIKAKLKDYKSKKATVETTLARIENYRKILADPNIEEYGFTTYFREPGMPRVTDTHSQVESSVVEREITRDMIREWVMEDEGRIRLLQMEVQQIDLALEGLLPGERLIVECKYFDNMFWSAIEITYNNTFRLKQDVTADRIRQIHKEALEKLIPLLTPFYIRIGA